MKTSMSKPTVASRVKALKAIPLFAELSDRSLRRILDFAADFEVPAGWVLVQPNMEGSGFFVVEQGTVTVRTHNKTFELGSGEFFGELALLTDEATREARVTAKTATSCLAISRADFTRLLEEEPKVALAMLKTLAKRLVQAQQ